MIVLVLQLIVVQQAMADAVVKVRAVEYGDAIIPCGQSKIFLDGPEAFVSWLKDDRRVVYRFPINNSNTDERSFNEICYRSPDIKACRERTSLFLPRVTKDDAGFYRCRIHYNASPAVDFDYHLTVVGTPGRPQVFIEDTPLTDDFVGPVKEGSDVTMICKVKDSSENAVVQWEHDGQKVAGSNLVEPGIHTSVLKLRSIQRDQHGARYACIAQTADVTPPKIKIIQIIMKLPPLSIAIDLDENYDFEAGNPKVIDCIVKGFVPAPNVEWYLDKKPLKTGVYQVLPGDNVTLSTITFVPQRGDDGRKLKCIAKNKYFDEVFTSDVKLRVGFKPTCVMRSRYKIEIKPNVAEKVVCVVDSHPPPIAFTWNFSNKKIVATPVQATDIPTRFKSTLSWIPHNDEIGKLYCTATNYHGEQEEACEFEIGRSNCTNEKGDKVFCKHDETKETTELAVDEETKTERAELIIPTSSLNWEDGSQVIENNVPPLKDNTPWWIQYVFMLGSLFLIGILSYPIRQCINSECKRRRAGLSRPDMRDLAERTHSNRMSSSLSSEELGLYHREPDVVGRFNHQTNISIIPTTALPTARQNGPPYNERVQLKCVCDENRSFCV